MYNKEYTESAFVGGYYLNCYENARKTFNKKNNYCIVNNNIFSSPAVWILCVLFV
jgi:hypothetical protein